MAFAESLENMNRYDQAMDTEELMEAMHAFKDVVRGNPACDNKEDEELEETEDLSVDEELNEIIDPEEENMSTPVSAYNSFIEDLKKNACRTEKSSRDEIPQQVEEESCKTGSSVVEKLVRELSKLEIEEVGKELDLKKYERLISSIIRKAKRYKAEVQRFVRSGADEDEKRKVILEYIEKVAVSMRDLHIVLKPNSKLANRFANDYLFNIPTGLFEEFTDEYDYLMSGKNPAQDPFFLELVENGDYTKLKFDEHSMIKRDIQTILQFPLAKNYLYALRLMTIQMMVSQIKTYDVLMGKGDAPVKMPRACTTRKENGVWPAQLDIKIKDEISDGYLDAVLENHGLYYNYGNELILNYYVEDSSINPLKDALFGSVEFNNYTNGNQGVDAKNYYSFAIKPSFDDVTAWKDFFEMKRGQAEYVYKFEQKYSNRRGRSAKKDPHWRTFKDAALFQEIIGEESPYKFVDIKKVTKEGERVEQVRPFVLNASPYITNKLIQLGTDKIEDIIDTETEKLLKRNVLNMDMPTLYSPSASRNWGLRKLQEVVASIKDTKAAKVTDRRAPEIQAITTACMLSQNRFCQENRGKNLYEALDSYLSSLTIDGRYLPIKKLEEKSIKQNYVFFAHLWRQFRDRLGLIPEAKIVEYNYLIDQMGALNPIARMRLGYLLAKQELKNLKAGIKPTYKKTSRGMRATYDSTCFKANVDQQMDRLDDAAKTLLLHKPLTPNFLTKHVSKDDYKELWGKIVDTANGNSSQLFSAKYAGSKVYDFVEKISYKTILDDRQVDEAVDDILEGKVSDETRDALDESLDNQEVDRIGFFKELMKVKNHEQRKEMFLERAEDFGINDDLTLKEQILAVDMSLKRHLYRDIMKKGAAVRKAETLKKLEDICKSDEEDHEGLRKSFYGTMKVQDNLNQLIGLPAAPKALMDQINSQSFEELLNAGLAFGSFIVGMAGVMLAGSCAVLTGGLCGILVVGMVGSAVGLQSYVTYSEVGMKLNADKSVDHVDEMADLGYSNSTAADNVSRSWAWAIIEGVSIIPLMGLFARGVHMGSKMTKQAVKTIVLNSKKVGFRNAYKMAGKAARTVADEADVELSKLVLGFRSYKDKIKAVFKGVDIEDAAKALKNVDMPAEHAAKIQNKITRIQKLQAAGKISPKKVKSLTQKLMKEIKEQLAKNPDALYKYTSTVSTDITFKAVDKNAAKTVATYFGGNPSELRGFMGTYIKKFYPKKKLLGGTKASKLAKARAGYIKAKKGEFLKGTNWIRQAWYENTYNMAKNRAKYLRIYDELSKLPKGQFEEYLMKNMDELTDVFVKAPLRKRDFPYLLIQGGPHMGGLLNGRRIPGLQEIGEAVVVRKMFNARARLISEAAKAQARSLLGMKKVVAADTLSNIFKGFYASSREEAKRLGGKKGAEVIKELAAIRMHVAEEMFTSLGKNPKYIKLLEKEGIKIFAEGRVNKKLLYELIFNPKSIKEETLSDMMWGLVDIEKVFAKDEFQFVAYKMMREKMDDSSVIGLQKYLNSVKILMIRDGSALGNVELF
jgi:uncharacterized protein YktA (UPF0223 family)